MKNKIPRPEHPRAQFARKNWQNLNGEWNFAFDDQNQGEKNCWYQNKKLEEKITVPFTFETKASGIADRSQHNYIWYQRSFEVEAEADQKIILNFGAVDYLTKVWLNGYFIGSHEGAYDSFNFEISDFVNYQGKNNIVVKVEDSLSKIQPRGKQTYKKDNFLCWYTRSTGIWQSVWLEFMDQNLFLKDLKITPDLDQKEVKLDYNFEANSFVAAEYKLSSRIEFDGRVINEFELDIKKNYYSFKINLEDEKNELKIWQPGNPNLYDLKLVLYKNDQAVDRIDSYFGMRKISIVKDKVYLNNKPIYQKLILDQGYWPESLITPPSDQALKKDLELIKEMGFNGVRKHQKIEDNRFYYWADKLGLLVWAEMGSTYQYNDQAVANFSSQWLSVVRELYNHPSIICWVPFNESWGIEDVAKNKKQQNFTESIYYLTKSIDKQRPIISNDGWEHTISDIITFHDYVENTEKLKKTYLESIEELLQNKKLFNNQEYIDGGKFIMADNYQYQGQPIIFSEFGGIAFQDKKGWGYGKQVKTKEELSLRMNQLMKIIKEANYFEGYCYTQLTDVEQEKNGLLDENREFKLELEKIKEFNQIIER